METPDLAELYDRLNSPPYKEVLKDYEFEEVVHAFLHSNFGELFNREVQIDYE